MQPTCNKHLEHTLTFYVTPNTQWNTPVIFFNRETFQKAATWKRKMELDG